MNKTQMNVVDPVIGRSVNVDIDGMALIVRGCAGKIAGLEVELAQSKQARAGLEGEVNKFDVENKALEGRAVTAEASLNQAEDGRKRLGVTLKKRNVELKKKTDELTQLNGTLDSLKETNIAMQESITRMRQDLDALGKEKTKLEKELTQQKGENDDLYQKCIQEGDKCSQLEVAKEALAKRIEKLEKLEDELKGELETAKMAFELSDVREGELEDRVGELKKKLLERQNAINGLVFKNKKDFDKIFNDLVGCIGESVELGAELSEAKSWQTDCKNFINLWKRPVALGAGLACGYLTYSNPESVRELAGYALEFVTSEYDMELASLVAGVSGYVGSSLLSKVGLPAVWGGLKLVNGVSDVVSKAVGMLRDATVYTAQGMYSLAGKLINGAISLLGMVKSLVVDNRVSQFVWNHRGKVIGLAILGVLAYYNPNERKALMAVIEPVFAQIWSMLQGMGSAVAGRFERLKLEAYYGSEDARNWGSDAWAVVQLQISSMLQGMMSAIVSGLESLRSGAVNGGAVAMNWVSDSWAVMLPRIVELFSAFVEWLKEVTAYNPEGLANLWNEIPGSWNDTLNFFRNLVNATQGARA